MYHYRTTDLRIDVSYEVILPVGDNNYERESIAKTVEFCRWRGIPYLLLKKKEIRRLEGDAVGIPMRPDWLKQMKNFPKNMGYTIWMPKEMFHNDFIR